MDIVRVVADEEDMACTATPSNSSDAALEKPKALSSAENNKARNDPSRMAESSAINKSLSVLGQVVHAINQGASRISYRKSKLTRILQDALGGSSAFPPERSAAVSVSSETPWIGISGLAKGPLPPPPPALPRRPTAIPGTGGTACTGTGAECAACFESHRGLRRSPTLPGEAFMERERKSVPTAPSTEPMYSGEGHQLSFSNIAQQDQLIGSPEFTYQASLLFFLLRNVLF
ncbi:hypothetical protein C8J57DRAFT_1595283 [Mycena rebaudengoi]|nr:hypothetical protein C8J57DRAFT_1595283 [Mycena rebaudengoi]